MIIIFVFVKDYLYIYYVIQYSINFELLVLYLIGERIFGFGLPFPFRMYIPPMAALAGRGRCEGGGRK